MVRATPVMLRKPEKTRQLIVHGYRTEVRQRQIGDDRARRYIQLDMRWGESKPEGSTHLLSRLNSVLAPSLHECNMPADLLADADRLVLSPKRQVADLLALCVTLIS